MLDFGQNHHGLTDSVIYARISSKAQEKKGMGISSQIAYCKQFAQWKQYHVHQVFKDSSVTGSRADREGIKEMLAFLKKNKGKRFVCLVDDVSRLARDIRVHLDLRDAIDSCGAILESPTMTFGVDADGRYFENMQAASAQHHREKNAEQTKKRQQGRFLNSYYPFPAPIGLKHVHKPGHGKVMEPDEPIASIIRTALENYANGVFQTQAEVARYLESQPDFPKNRYGKVTNEAANRILKRVLYAGYVEMPKWNIPLTKGKHTGLINFSTYQKIQDRIHGKAKVPARANLSADFPLRGFVLCSCGKPLTACWSKSKTGKKHPYYQCFNKDCEDHRKSIPRARLEGDFENLLSNIEPSETTVNLTKDMLRKAWSMLTEHEAAYKHSVKQTLAELDRKVEKLLDKLVDTV